MSVKDDTENLLIAVGVGIAAYLAYQAYSAAKAGVQAIGNATNAAGTSIGSALYNLFNPNAAGESTFYTATLPNGTQASVPASSVDANGITTVGGTQYQMYVDNSVTSGVNKTLVPLNQTQLDNQAAADQFASF